MGYRLPTVACVAAEQLCAHADGGDVFSGGGGSQEAAPLDDLDLPTSLADLWSPM